LVGDFQLSIRAATSLWALFLAMSAASAPSERGEVRVGAMIQQQFADAQVAVLGGYVQGRYAGQEILSTFAFLQAFFRLVASGLR